MKTTTRIKTWWSDYDRAVGQCHLENFGVIFLDHKGYPIDNEYELEEILVNYRNFTGGVIR